MTHEIATAALAQMMLETATLIVSGPESSAVVVKAPGRDALDIARGLMLLGATDVDIYERGDGLVWEWNAAA